MNLLILACSATKRHDAEPLPALERYDGPAWRVLRKALRERPYLGANLDTWALSARYGLISATMLIPDYNQRMTRAQAEALRPLVRVHVKALSASYDGVFINVGADYRLALPGLLPWPVVWATGGTGERLGQLKRWLWE